MYNFKNLEFELFKTDCFKLAKELEGDDLLSTHCAYVYDSDDDYIYLYTVSFSLGSSTISYFTKPKIHHWEITLKTSESDHILTRNHLLD